MSPQPQRRARPCAPGKLPLSPKTRKKNRRWYRPFNKGIEGVSVLQRTTTYYSVLQRTTTYYNVLQRTTAYYSVLQRTTTYYNVLQRTTAYDSVRQRTTTYDNVLQRTTAYYSVLQRTTTYYKRSMLCPERDKHRLAFHKCLGSRRPMMCPE